MKSLSYTAITLFLLFCSVSFSDELKIAQIEIPTIHSSQYIISGSYTSEKFWSSNEIQFFKNNAKLNNEYQEFGHLNVKGACYHPGKFNESFYISAIKFAFFADGTLNSNKDKIIITGGNFIAATEKSIFKRILNANEETLEYMKNWISHPDGMTLFNTEFDIGKVHESCHVTGSLYLVDDTLRIFIDNSCYNGGGTSDYFLKPCNNPERK